MEKVLALMFTFVALISLNGCMTTQEAAAKYDNMSAEDLCFSYLSLPDYNIWQGDRRASIQKGAIVTTIATSWWDLLVTLQLPLECQSSTLLLS